MAAGAAVWALLLVAAALPPARANALHELHFHRSEPKLTNANGPCSTTLDIAAVAWSADRALGEVSKRLGFPAARLEWRGEEVVPAGSLAHIPAGEVLEVFERAPAGELQAQFPAYELSITDHSLRGSAAALMTAVLLPSSGGGGAAAAAGNGTMTTNTFGEQRTGNAAFALGFSEAAARHDAAHFRVDHYHDIIPHYLFREMPGDGSGACKYHHLAPEIWLSENSTTDTRCDSGEDRSCLDG